MSDEPVREREPRGDQPAQQATPGPPPVAARYEPPRLLSVAPLEEIAAACAPANPTGPGKTFPGGCASPGS